jgi:energy-converting hydrogenase B subunit Q
MAERDPSEDGHAAPAGRRRAEIAEPDGFVDPKTIGLHDDGTIALLVRVQVPDQPGVLHALTRVIFEHRANITYVDLGERRQPRVTTYFELSDVHDLDALVHDLEALPIVRDVERAPSFGRIYG